MISVDVAALDADLRKWIEGRVGLAVVFDAWVAGRPMKERAEMNRFIAERIHDVLRAWAAPTAPPGPPVVGTRVP